MRMLVVDFCNVSSQMGCHFDFFCFNFHYSNVSKTIYTFNGCIYLMRFLGPVFMIALLCMVCGGGGADGGDDTGSLLLCIINAYCEAEQICVSAKCWTQVQ